MPETALAPLTCAPLSSAEITKLERKVSLPAERPLHIGSVKRGVKPDHRSGEKVEQSTGIWSVALRDLRGGWSGGMRLLQAVRCRTPPTPVELHDRGSYRGLRQQQDWQPTSILEYDRRPRPQLEAIRHPHSNIRLLLTRWRQFQEVSWKEVCVVECKCGVPVELPINLH